MQTSVDYCDLKSSYNNDGLKFYHIFQTVVSLVKPKKVVEFGILKGYSLKAFVEFCDSDCQIEAYDIFDRFNGNGAKLEEILGMFGKVPNVKIGEQDFYKGYENYSDGSIDILHIDIANNGDVYQFAFEKYFSKLSDKGVMILEGGSEARDNVSWMSKFGKRPIRDFLGKLLENSDYRVDVIDVFPSITLISRRR